MAPKTYKRPAAALSSEAAAEAVANGVEPVAKKNKDDSDNEAMCYWHAHEILSSYVFLLRLGLALLCGYSPCILSASCL